MVQVRNNTFNFVSIYYLNISFNNLEWENLISKSKVALEKYQIQHF